MGNDFYNLTNGAIAVIKLCSCNVGQIALQISCLKRL